MFLSIAGEGDIAMAARENPVTARSEKAPKTCQRRFGSFNSRLRKEIELWRSMQVD
jgi:hypothetical protein